MLLKTKLKMRDVLKECTEQVKQEAEELIYISKLENNFTDNTFPFIRDTILKKIQWVVDYSARNVTPMDQHKYFTAKKLCLEIYKHTFENLYCIKFKWHFITKTFHLQQY